MKSFYVVIPVFNPPKEFLDNFSSLYVHSGISFDQIILVDDGSTNGVSQKIKKKHPECILLRGDGNLWWCGGMRVGMEEALRRGTRAIVWLNHDCLPDEGTVAAIAEEASQVGRGCVSAWCYCKDAPEFSVNPGFRGFRQIPTGELDVGDLVEVDGVNGNCVALNADAIRKVGFPNARKHPHYGDGPYTFRLHRAGFHNFVLPSVRAALERDYSRCVSVFWRCAFWRISLLEKFRYFLCSHRSQFHWRHRFNDSVVFRGTVAGPAIYFGSMMRLVASVVAGHFFGFVTPVKKMLDIVSMRYGKTLPNGELATSLLRLRHGE